jgi:hypothetical protein
MLAAGTQLASAAASAALTSDRAHPKATRKLHDFAFIVGGSLHAAALGGLVGALGYAGLRSRELPHNLSVGCLAVAPIGMLAPLTLAAKPLMPAIPIGRLSALIVSGIAGARMSRSA